MSMERPQVFLYQPDQHRWGRLRELTLHRAAAQSVRQTSLYTAFQQCTFNYTLEEVKKNSPNKICFLSEG